VSPRRFNIRRVRNGIGFVDMPRLGGRKALLSFEADTYFQSPGDSIESGACGTHVHTADKKAFLLCSSPLLLLSGY
jgi:hypothetical protein